jgi:sugar lactone lactonase YvrE
MTPAFRSLATLILLCSCSDTFAHPASGIAVDERGFVYFVDSLRGVWREGEGGKLQLINESAMHWMAIDREGRFANAPAEFGEWFGRLTPKGGKPTLISCSDSPCVVGKDGNLYFAHMHSLNIKRRTPGGLESLLVAAEKFGFAKERPIGVSGMACGADGSIYVVALDSLNRHEGTGEHALFAVAMDGAIRMIAKEFVKEKIAESEEHPDVRPQYCRGMAMDKDGNIFIAVTGSRCVMKLTQKGEGSVVVRCKKPWSPTGVDVFNGELYVLEFDDETPTQGRSWPLRVRKVGRDGSVVTLARVRNEGSQQK